MREVRGEKQQGWSSETERSVSILQGMEDIPYTARNSLHSSLNAVSLFCPVYSFPPIPYSILCLLSNAFNIIDILAFLQTALKFPHPLQFLTSLLQTQRCTQAFLKLAISLHRLGNVAHWQTVFVVGVGRWWSWVFFFMCGERRHKQCP